MNQLTLNLLRVSCLLLASGTCALCYQMTWFREFRLIFGGSTAASAAVMAIFMGGLGLGGLILGRRVDRHDNPLALYAKLELGIALSAALTPALLWLASQSYIGIGGTLALGATFGTILRILLAVVVLAVPTFLMGGTLPAVVRAIETKHDVGRRHLALLYGANTFGAVAGVMLASFLLLEIFGNRNTIWLAALVNVLVALIARNMSRSLKDEQAETSVEGDQSPAGVNETLSPPPKFVLFAAAAVGFAFFLMELVWYRMLGPIMGGTTFTFGIILAVALAGIGLGGAGYAFFGRRRSPSLGGFALVCVLEAALLALPYALGDWVASLALLLRPLGTFGFYGFVLSWIVVCAIVVLPGAIVSGYQFPMLIALLGKGRDAVGSHLGAAYAWNTVGAILGSLAGGFGLLPLLTAPGAWCLVVLLLLLLGSVAAVLSARIEGARLSLVWPSLVSLCAVCFLLATGPTAAWRHNSIGAGRTGLSNTSPNTLKHINNLAQRRLRFEAEGVESSIALTAESGWAFWVNGKIDGNCRSDAGTQVMSGMLLALLHPDPQSAFVVGLGTGSTGGWLGSLPSMDRVDVAELEPAIVETARRCSAINQDVLDNPKVKLLFGDGREQLLTTDRTYDLILSEPSNPYRAGIASLYTVDFYRAVFQRLHPDGLFGQWLQAYEIDSQTVRTVVATVATVFPAVQIWQTQFGDLLLVAGRQEPQLSVSQLQKRITQQPYAKGLSQIWRVNDVEGVLARYIAPAAMAREVAHEERDFVNTDDRNVLEFWYARTLGSKGLFPIDAFMRQVRSRYGYPKVQGSVNWRRVQNYQAQIPVLSHSPLYSVDVNEAEQVGRLQAVGHYGRGDLTTALAQWQEQPRQPENPLELEMVAESLADAGLDEARVLIPQVRAFQETTAEAILARLEIRQGNNQQAQRSLLKVLKLLQKDPWPSQPLIVRTLHTIPMLVKMQPELGEPLWQALQTPFSILLLDVERRKTLLAIAQTNGFEERCVEALRSFEPYPMWNGPFLELRVRCYSTVKHPLQRRAELDYQEFLSYSSIPFFLNTAQSPSKQPGPKAEQEPAALSRPATQPAPQPEDAGSPLTL